MDRWAPEWTRGTIDNEAFAKEFDHFAVTRYFGLPRGWFRQATNASQRLRVRSALEAMARGARASVIHAQTEGMTPMALDVARLLGVPAVVTIHGVNTDPRYLGSPQQKALLSPALRDVNRLVLVGEPLRSVFGEYADRDDHIRIVPNGVQLPRRRRSTPILATNVIRVVSVSNLNEGKGVDITLDALALLDSRGIRNWSYTIVGDGPERPGLEARARKLAIADRAFFVGARAPDDVFETLLASDLFVLPSYREAFGIAYLEAMACGLVAIGVAGQGPETFIDDGETGFLVEPHSARAVADCIAQVIEHPPDARRVAERAAHHAQAFSWDAHARRLIDVYSELVPMRAAHS